MAGNIDTVVATLRGQARPKAIRSLRTLLTALLQHNPAKLKQSQLTLANAFWNCIPASS